LIAFAAAAFLTGLSKGGLGGMMGALITAMLALVLPIQNVIGLVLPILMLGDLFAVTAHWRRWDRRLILALLPGALLGVTLGTFVLTSISPLALRRGLALIILVFIIYRLLERRILAWLHYTSRSWHGILAGGLSGLASTLAHAGGPPVSIYLLMEDINPAAFAATAAVFFAVINWIKVPYYLYAGLFDFAFLWRVIWLAPLVPLGVWFGRKLVERVGRPLFEAIIMALLVASAGLLLMP
jgi:uncharacterized membrane protein YfcA